MNLNDIAIYGIAPLLSLSVWAAFYRLLIGPSIADRVVALDLMSTLAIGIIVFVAIVSDEAGFLDVATVLALTTFLGTIAFAYYIEQRGSQ